jgi:hypothetical protein
MQVLILTALYSCWLYLHYASTARSLIYEAIQRAFSAIILVIHKHCSAQSYPRVSDLDHSQCFLPF